jgi:hypothetical protein
MLKVLLLVVTLGILLPAATPGEAVAQKPPPPPWGAFATEELAARLLPFLPAATEAPSGYRFGPMVVETPAILAQRIAQPGEDPRAALARTPNLPVVQISQEFLPAEPRGSPPLPFFVIARLAPDPTAAADNVSPSRRPEGVLALDAGDGLGEERDAFLDPRTRPDQPPAETLVVRWRRGGVVLEFIRGALAGESDVAGTLAYAAQLDAKAARLPLPGETPPTVTPPATEGERLEALLRLRTFSVLPEDLPASYWPAISGMALHPAQAVVNTARFQQVDVAELVRRSAETFGQVYLGGGWLTNAPEEAVRGLPDEAWPGVRVVYFASLDADEAAAGRQVRDPYSMLMGALGPERTPAPAPVTLGEETFVWQVRLDGTESWALRWRHGSVVLFAESVGPVGALGFDELVDLARAVEAAYQRSDLAR